MMRLYLGTHWEGVGWVGSLHERWAGGEEEL